VRCLVGLLLVASALVPASAGAGAEAARPALALTVTPAHLALAGTDRATVRIANPGAHPVVVDVARSGFSLDLHGRPHVARRHDVRAAAGWLAVRPARFVLAPSGNRLLTVASRLPRRAEPGDHDALVLLATRPVRGAGVAVRVRIGIVVVVRAPGRVVRRVVVRRLRVRRLRHAGVLELVLANRGNVTESFPRGAIRVTLGPGRTRVALLGARRELRPHSSGLVRFRLDERLRRIASARVTITGAPGRPAVIHTFRLRL
jgi:hypothetical protein